MKKDGILFVRIDTRNEKSEFGETDFVDHIKYLTQVATERYLMGGGFEKKNGGMIVFEAKDLDEATRICDNDPLILRQLYTYELMQWNIAIG